MVPGAFGAADAAEAAVVTGKGSVMGQKDRLAMSAFDHGGHNVPFTELGAGNIIFLSLFPEKILVKTSCLGGHGGQG